MQSTRELTGEFRRTLKDINASIPPSEIYNLITDPNRGMKYRLNRDFLLTRDRALLSTCYLIGSRISEAVRLVKSQFRATTDNKYILVTSLLLSKRRPGVKDYRPQLFMPLEGERAQFTGLVIKWLEICGSDRIFKMDRSYGWRVINALTGYPPHWFRAFCEDYLYESWNKDIIAVAEYLKVKPETIPLYIRGRFRLYDRF